MSLQQAYDLFKLGKFGQALTVSAQLIQDGIADAEHTPLAKCISYQTVFYHLQDNPEEAYRTALLGMRYTHYDENLHKAFEFLKNETMPEEPGPIIFGLGTGRSGSTSLAAILNSPEENYVTHEHPFLVPWALGEKEIDWHLERMAWLSHYYSLVGDVAHWWLPYVEYIIDKCPLSAFIAIKRSKQETVKSFVNLKLKPDGRFINHWTNHDGKVFHKNLWDRCYPKYGINMPLDIALESYWQDYYDECERLASKFPSKFVMLDLQELSTTNVLISALNSVGISMPKSLVDFKKNVGGGHDSQQHASIPFRALTQ